MATLEKIFYTPRRPEVNDGVVKWVNAKAKPIKRLPQICWKDGSTWDEANLWALELATSGRKDIKTVTRCMSHILGYAKWTEAEDVSWAHFPASYVDRCLPRFRGALIQARNDGYLAPSTASQRMSTVIRLYRWLTHVGLLSTDRPMWSERQVRIKLKDGFGLEHTLRVTSTNLSVPNRKVAGAFVLEDGLLPVSLSGMRAILALADLETSDELALMLRLGFQTGLRVGSITDLKLQTIMNASIDPVVGWHRLAVGPGAKPRVATKFGVSGMIPIPSELLDTLMRYATSTRRLKRQAQAAPEDRDLLFLTRYGDSYGQNGCGTVNVEMSRLREAGRAAGIDVLHGFHFHRSRATFATELMRVALGCLPVGDAVALVREACLHKDDATTLRYVRFIESSKAMADLADAFAQAFLGLAKAYGESRA